MQKTAEAFDNTLIFVPISSEATERKAVVAEWQGRELSIIV